MAPEVSQDLIDSQAMAETLGTLDPTAISEHAMIAKLTRQIDLLALIKVDNNNPQLHLPGCPGHRQRPHVGRGDSDGPACGTSDAGGCPAAGAVDDPQTWQRYRAIWPHLSPSGAMWSADTGVGSPLIVARALPAPA